MDKKSTHKKCIDTISGINTQKRATNEAFIFYSNCEYLDLFNVLQTGGQRDFSSIHKLFKINCSSNDKLIKYFYLKTLNSKQVILLKAKLFYN